MKDKLKNKPLIVCFLAILLVLLSTFIIIFDYKTSLTEQIENVTATGLAPMIASSTIQTNRYNVEAQPYSIPGGAYLFQQESISNPKSIHDLHWVANTVVGDIKIKNTNNNTPETTTIVAPLDLNNYQKPLTFYFYRNGVEAREFKATALNDAYIKDRTITGVQGIKFLQADNYGWRTAKAVSVGGTKVHVTYEIGHKYPESTKDVFHTFPTGVKKHKIMYGTPFEVAWSGYVDESKEIRSTPDFTTAVGKTQNLKAEVRTKTGKGSWSAYYDVSYRPVETTWRSDNPNVVKVDNTGKITALKNGTATIHVNWKSSDGDYHITTKTVVKVQSSPYTTVTGENNACFNKIVNLKIEFMDYGGKISDVTTVNPTKYTSSDESIATVNKGVVSVKGKSGKVTITVQYSNYEAVKHEITVRDCTVPPPPPPSVPGVPEPEPEPIPENEPPTVEIIGPKEVVVGQYVCFTANGQDPDGFIEQYEWTANGFITTSYDTRSLCGYFENPGNYGFTVVVTDNGDINGDYQKQDDADYSTTAVLPTPQAYVNVTGTLKENREFALQASHAYDGNEFAYKKYPITKQTLTIEAVDTANQSKIFIQGLLLGNIDHMQVYNMLTKAAGDYKITRVVENSLGNSATYTTTITIAPDLAPIVDFGVPTLVYRDPTGTIDHAKAKFEIRNFSYSTDDEIQKCFVFYKYDSNNDGNFSDETRVTLSDQNEELVVFETTKVGKYLIEMECWEKFSQPTIAELVNLTFDKHLTDLMYADTATKTLTQKVVEVDNLGGTAQFDLAPKVLEKKQVDVQYDVLHSPYSKAQLNAITPYLNQLLSVADLQANISYSKEAGDLKFYSSNSTDRHFYITPSKRIFAIGYNAHGQLGDGTTTNKYSWTEIKTLPKSVEEIALGQFTTYFLLEDGTVYGVGNNARGQLGNGNLTGSITPIKINLPLKATGVYSTDNNAFFLLEDGSVYGVGDNSNGSVSNYQDPYGINYIIYPTKRVLPSKVVDISVSKGGDFVLFLLDTGESYGVGSSGSGQLGTGNNNTTTYDPRKTLLSQKIKKIVSNSHGTTYLLENGEVYKSGASTYGALGVGNSYYNSLTPSKLIMPVDTKVVNIFSSRSKTFYLLENGQVYATGKNYYSEISSNGGQEISTPINISLPFLVKDIILSEDTVVYLTTDGKVYGHGKNDYSAFGASSAYYHQVEMNLPNSERNTMFENLTNPLYMINLTNENLSRDFINYKLTDAKGYLVGIAPLANEGTYNNLILANNNRGKFIDIGSVYNDADLKSIIERLAAYIIESQKESAIEIEFLLDTRMGVSKTTLEQRIEDVLRPRVAPTADTKLITRVTEINDSFTFGNVLMGGENKFVVLLNNATFSARTQQHILASALSNNAHLINVGINYSSLVAQNMKKGTHIGYSNVDQALQQISSYVLSTVETSGDLKELFVTTDEEVSYFPRFDDFERDPKQNEYWKFGHSLGYFTSETGQFGFHQSKIPSPIRIFDQTGMYRPAYGVLDNPLLSISTNVRDKFSSYQKWSNEASNWLIYVHKKPSSEFKFTLNSLTGDYSVTNEAHDVDKYNLNVGYGQGLQFQKFEHRINNGAWQSGLPSSPISANTRYEIKNIAVDFQGKESVTIKALSRSNLPPVAEFEPDKWILYSLDESVKLANRSYDPNYDNLTARWFLKSANADDSSYREFASGTLTNGVASANWHPTLSNLSCNTPQTLFCEFDIRLIVNDPSGATSVAVKRIALEILPTEIIEIGIGEVEVFTDQASKGLPVYLKITEGILNNNGSLIDEARQKQMLLHIKLNGQLHITAGYTVHELINGIHLRTMPNTLQANKEYNLSFEIQSTDDQVVIKDIAKSLDIRVKTAEERTIKLNDSTYEYSGFLSARRVIGQAQVNTYEKITVHTEALRPTVTGLGTKIDQSFAHHLPTNRHYNSSMLPIFASDLTYSAALIDSHYEGLNVSSGLARVQSVQTVNSTTSNQNETISIVKLSHPKVMVEKNTGHLFSEAQVANGDARIQDDILDGGHKLYTPIWLDSIGDYDIQYKTTAIGVNKVRFEKVQSLPIEAYMFLHINSTTKDKDKWLLEPVIKKNPFPNGLPAEWTEEDVNWLKN